MYQLFESIRVENGIAQSIYFHQFRVNKSLQCGAENVNLESYINSISFPKKGIFKLKIIYSKEGINNHYISVYTNKNIESLMIVNGDNLTYNNKYLDRSQIDKALELKGECDDILIIKNGLVSDTSYSNIALYDKFNSIWVTPDSPLLEGTCRASLLQSGKLTPIRVELDDLFKGRYIKLVMINAMIGFDPESSGLELKTCLRRTLV